MVTTERARKHVHPSCTAPTRTDHRPAGVHTLNPYKFGLWNAGTFSLARVIIGLRRSGSINEKLADRTFQTAIQNYLMYISIYICMVYLRSKKIREI
jgi:hypothetical protein